MAGFTSEVDMPRESLPPYAAVAPAGDSKSFCDHVIQMSAVQGFKGTEDDFVKSIVAFCDRYAIDREEDRKQAVAQYTNGMRQVLKELSVEVDMAKVDPSQERPGPQPIERLVIEHHECQGSEPPATSKKHTKPRHQLSKTASQ
jgi:hypothetical protein